jgi:excisionase family DNA binding protein
MTARATARMRPVEPVLVTREEAARLLAMSVDHLERHVLGEMRVVRSGRLVLVPVAELHRFAERNAVRTLESAA